MNWIKENKKLAGILGVMIVGALGLGVFLFLSYSAYAARVDEYSTVGGKVKALKSQKLFPSAANSEEKDKLVTDYAEKVNLLRSALLNPAVQQPVTPITETDFQAKLKDRSTLVKKAAESSNILLPADFALGFEDYTTTVPRSPDVAAELNLHLDVIEKLVATLIESGVKSLDSLERTKLPSEKGAPPEKAASAAPARPVRPAPARGGAKKPLITAAAAAEPVLDRYPIKLILTTDQAPFQAVMNVLSDPAKTPNFLVVRQLRIENEKPAGPLKSEMKITPPSTEGGEPPASRSKLDVNAPESLSPPPAAAPDTITVLGEEMLKVYLEVDYIRFRKAATDEGDATPAKP